MIAVVIVTFQSADVIGRCLQSCVQFARLEVVVVDNASSDDTLQVVKRFPTVRLIENRQNAGFAAAVNQGFRMTDAEFVLILNPDTDLLTDPETLSVLCDGAAGGALLDEDGKPQEGFAIRSFPRAITLAFEVLGWNRLFPWNRVNRAYRLRIPNAVSEVDQPAGAFLMVRRSAWTAVGGFDESFYPVWFEDVDFCLRLKNAGYRIVYVPEARAYHVGGHSADRISWESRETYWYGSLLRYAVKHFSPVGRFLVAVSVSVGVLLRMSVQVLVHRNWKAVSVYSRVMGLAVRCAVTGRGAHFPAPTCFTVNP